MVQYIQVETGVDPALFRDLIRKCATVNKPSFRNINTESFRAGTDTRSFYFAMLEAGMSVVAVNLPSLRLSLKSVIPERLVHSVRSLISLSSLSSQRRSGLNGSASADDATKGSTTHLGRKPDSSSSINSGRPDFPSDLSQLHYHRQMMAEQHLSGNLVEAIAMRNPDSNRQQGQKTWVPERVINVENSV
jgi:hypothetical protein